MYQVLFYLKDKPCDIKKGFPTREAAWRWVESRLDDIDWYKIEAE
jgi:hypothetical protein